MTAPALAREQRPSLARDREGREVRIESGALAVIVLGRRRHALPAGRKVGGLEGRPPRQRHVGRPQPLLLVVRIRGSKSSGSAEGKDSCDEDEP
jgi:hypothetical protein